MIALHTPEGIVLYANDFKLDDTPIVGLKPNYEKLKEIAKDIFNESIKELEKDLNEVVKKVEKA